MKHFLAQHTAFITGAGQGIGRAVAQELAAMGAHVVVADINADAVQQTAQSIVDAGYPAQAVVLDVADAAACRAVAADLQLPPGHQLLLVNNAGLRPKHAFDSEDRDALWQRTMAVNVDGARNTILAFQALLAASKGSVVNVTSLAASRAAGSSIAYSTSKAALEMLTKTMALELAPQSIRVNAVAPGVMLTSMTEQTRKDPKHVEYMLRRIPMKRYGEAAEIAGPIAFLASPMASYVTATVLNADGGYLAV